MRRVEGQLEEEQCRFMPNRSTIDHIFTLRQVREKTIHYNKELHLCFIDPEKDFDRIPWSSLWPILERRGAALGLIQRIKSFYKNFPRTVIRIQNILWDKVRRCFKAIVVHNTH